MINVLVMASSLSIGAETAPAGERLRLLLDRHWESSLQRDPVAASLRGDHRFDDAWPDLSPAALRRESEGRVAALAELTAIPRSELSAADRVNADLLAYSLEREIEGERLGEHLAALTPLSGIQTTANLAGRLRFESPKDYEDWVARLRSFPAYMDGTLALLRRGIEQRRLPPKVVVRRIAAQVERLLAEEPAASGYYGPFAGRPPGLSAPEAERLAAAARSAITEAVYPALRRLHAFLAGPYSEAAPVAVGLGSRPDGAGYYAYLVRRHTTTRLTPREIHEIGLREVERVGGEMTALASAVGGPPELGALVQFLRTDPRFEFKSAEDVLAAARACAKRIDPTLVRLFRTLPRTPYGVEEIPAAMARDAPASYSPPAADGSRAGYCRVNTRRPPRTWLMTSLLLHEAVPGHHLQAALALEQIDLPGFRRHARYTAFVEGWALYAESLGGELGLYADPLPRIGHRAAELARAARLVVDTGLHLRGWSREAAVAYLATHVPMSQDEIEAEVDRMIAIPGQALAYKIGELKIKELRSRAEAVFGPTVDVREFHDVVLGSGPLPLDLLEATVDAWIAARRESPSSP